MKRGLDGDHGGVVFTGWNARALTYRRSMPSNALARAADQLTSLLRQRVKTVA